VPWLPEATGPATGEGQEDFEAVTAPEFSGGEQDGPAEVTGAEAARRTSRRGRK
jgi:hypothetical protein